MVKKIFMVLLLVCGLLSGCSFFEEDIFKGTPTVPHTKDGASKTQSTNEYQPEANADPNKATLATTPQKWYDYHNTQMGIYAKRPPLWKVREVQDGFAMEGPVPGGTGAMMVVRFNAQNFSLQQIVEQRRNTYQREQGYSTQLDQVMQGNNILGTFDYNFRYKRQGNQESLAGIERVTIINGKVYIINFAVKPEYSYKYNVELEGLLFGFLHF